MFKVEYNIHCIERIQMANRIRSLIRVSSSNILVVRNNCHRSSLGAVARSEYLRKYEISLIRPDGSSIGIRASEPLKMFGLPIDVKELTEEERLQMIASRKPKVKKIVQEVIDDNFDSGTYMNLWSTNESSQSLSSSKPEK